LCGVGGRLAYTDSVGEIRLRELDSGEERVVAGRWMMEAPGSNESRILFRWPTWSPLGDRIAFEGLVVGEDGIERAVLWVASQDGVLAEAYEELPLTGLVYLRWRADGSRLLHLTETGNGDLRLGQVGDGSVPVAGAPLFLGVTPEDAVLCHVFAGEPDRAQLLWIDPTGAEARTITDRPGSFRAPCVIADGTLVFTLQRGDSTRGSKGP
jgi:hypothetical protein